MPVGELQSLMFEMRSLIFASFVGKDIHHENAKGSWIFLCDLLTRRRSFGRVGPVQVTDIICACQIAKSAKRHMREFLQDMPRKMARQGRECSHGGPSVRERCSFFFVTGSPRGLFARSLLALLAAEAKCQVAH